MFLLILQTEEQSFNEITMFLFVGLFVVAFFFNRFKSKFTKKALWIIGSIIIAAGIFLSFYEIENVSILFGVVVIFFGITVMPLKVIFDIIKAKTIKPKPKTSNEESDESDYNYTQVKSEEYIIKGQKYKDEKKYQKAIDSFVKALSVNANSAESWFELGQINLIRNRIPEALTCYERTVDIKPNYPEAIERIKEVEQILKDSGMGQDQ
jgi:tetratricopeptide (TPR) repeat protein